MNAPHREWVVENSAWAGAQARLSVLIPFLRDDPCALLRALDRQPTIGGAVEIVALDDGSNDEVLAARVEATIEALALPARFVRLTANEGRSKGRNRLAGHARADQFLFLDSDMLPDSPGFIGAYLDLIESSNPPVAFGGFSVAQVPPRRDLALHRAMAAKSDCLPAARRRLRPEKSVFTSNLLIRRDVFDTEGFDESFKGWGWEDVEWAARIVGRHAIVHFDNPATHLGLDTPAALIAKYRQSAPNFARIAQAHPEILAHYPSYKAARLIGRAPLRGLLRWALQAIVLCDWAPLGLRALCLRMFRAALYAEVV